MCINYTSHVIIFNNNNNNNKYAFPDSYDATICHSFAECTGVDTTDIAWKQAQLSLRSGGFGLRPLVHHSPATYIASLCNSIELLLNHHLADAISQFNSHLSPSEALSFSSLSRLPTHHLRKIYQIGWNKLSLALFLIQVLGQIGLGLCQSHHRVLLHGSQSPLL